MRRKLVWVVAGLAAAVLAWEFVPIQVMVWDGGYQLTVRVERPEGRPRSVSVEAHGQRKDADYAVEHLLPPESLSSPRCAVADPFDGRPLTVWVPTSGRVSPFGRELQRMQFPYLAVVATLPDGRRVGKVVAIPDGRVSQEVTVTLP